MGTPRHEASKRMYGGPTDGGSYNGATDSYYSKRDARLRARDDTEGLQTSWREREQVEAFAKKHKIAPADLQDALAVVNEFEAFPKSPQTVEKRRAATLEALRIECGGHESAQHLVRNYVNLTTALAQEIPTLVTRVNATGAGEDGRIIKALARYGEQQPAVKE
jgi:hypothetical protein